MKQVAQAGTSLIVILILPIHILENAAGRKDKKLSVESRDRELAGLEEDQEKSNLQVVKILVFLTKKFLIKKNKEKVKKKKKRVKFLSRLKKYINHLQ